MPEFILPLGTPEAANEFANTDEFTRGYVEAAFFTSTGSGDDGDLEHATLADLAPESLASVVADCSAFQTEHAALLARAYDRDDYGAVEAGRDYWFTRNRHGVGFWDRQQLNAESLGDALSAACRWQSVYVYRGDDEKVYFQ